MTRTYSATRGGGAFLNGQRISVSKTEQLQRSLLVRAQASLRHCWLRHCMFSQEVSHLLVQWCTRYIGRDYTQHRRPEAAP